MRLLSISVLIMLVTSCGPSIMSESEFTDYCLGKLQVGIPEAECRIKSDLMIMVKVGESEIQNNLDNVYAIYKSEPSALEEIVAQYVESSKETFADRQGIDITQIVPVVKSRAYLMEALAATKVVGGLDSIEQICESYTDDIFIVYGENMSNSVKYFTKKEFATTGLERDSLLNLSLDNLDKIIPDVRLNGDSGYFLVTAGGYFESSLILFTNMWTKENFNVDGDIIIAIPTRELLFVTGSNDTKHIEEMRATAKEAYETESYSITPNLYRWNGEAFELYK